MKSIELFNPKQSLNLFGLQKHFKFLISLYKIKKFPKVLLLSGAKGIGKSTLVNHFLHYVYDEKNYDFNLMQINSETNFHKLFTQNLYPNLIYLSGFEFTNVKIEDIRTLKRKIFQKTIFSKERFIVLDEVDFFNIQSLNALLKIIEEPTNQNFFILINNKSKPLLDTIKSRSIEMRINLRDKERQEITLKLIEFHNQKLLFDHNSLSISPGNFLKFNNLFDTLNIDLNNDFLDNLKILLMEHKKEKNIFYLELIRFYIDYYLDIQKNNKYFTLEKFVEKRSFLFKNIYNYFFYNLNQNTLFNNINHQFKNE
tara:strand:- start:1616 stop:2551 length:936 start_codon:yes stop_codon:yes gene_type:complete